MKTKPAKASLTFGDLISNFYHTYGERKANGILRLAVKTDLVVFRGPNRYVVSRATRTA